MMIFFPRDVEYGFPQALYLFLLIVPIAFLLVSLSRYRQRRLADYAAASTISALLIPRSPVIATFKAIAICLVWLFASIALMDPKGNIRYLNMGPTSIQAPPPQEVVFLLDASASMGVKDSDSGQSRLQEAKQIISEIVSRLDGEPVALSAFTSETTILVPTTMDSLFLRLVLKQVQINEGDVGGTDLSAALKSVYQKIGERASPAFTSVILLSDGGDRYIEGLAGAARDAALQQLVDRLPHSSTNLMRLLVIGVGSAQGGIVPDVQFQGHPVTSRLDEAALQRVALAEEGALLLTGKQSAWHVADSAVEILRKWAAQTPARRDVVPAKASETLMDLYYQVPLAFALLLLALVFFLPNTRFWLFLAVSIPFQLSLQQSLDASEGEGRQAMALFAAGGDEQAIAWYEALLKETLPPWKKALVVYNIATIRLSQHHWDEALRLYRSIPFEAIESPLLVRYMKGNEALAYLGQAQSLPPDNDELALYLLQQSRWHIEEANKIDCQLREKFENLSTCVPSDDLKNLGEQVQQLSEAIKQQSREHLENAKEEEANTEDPQVLLGLALQQAIRALQLNGLVLAGQLADGVTAQSAASAADAVLKQTGPFLAAVRETQVKQFNATPKKGLKRCERKPWENVLPHFERGAEAAVAAKPRLAYREGLWLQEKTVWEWMKALESLQESSVTQQESEPPPEESEGSGTPASTQQLFRIIEEMVIEDTPNKQAPSKEIHEW